MKTECFSFNNSPAEQAASLKKYFKLLFFLFFFLAKIFLANSLANPSRLKRAGWTAEAECFSFNNPAEQAVAPHRCIV